MCRLAADASFNGIEFADSPERFARVGEIFLGRPIDALSVELVDLRVL